MVVHCKKCGEQFHANWLDALVEVKPEGYIYFLDLYRGKTRSNLIKNPTIALTVFSVREFKGYQFKGCAVLIDSGPLYDEMVAAWKTKKINIIGRRIIKNVRKGFSHGSTPAFLQISTIASGVLFLK